MKEFTLEEKISIISGFSAWVGGDMAKLDSELIADYLNFHKGDAMEILELLFNQGLLIKKDNGYFISKGGSWFVNGAILNLISKWSMIANAVYKQGFYTIQDAFLRYYSVRHPLRNLQMDVKAYVTDFCHMIMENLMTPLGTDYSLKGYPHVRKMMIRLSLVPLRFFVEANDIIIQNLIKSLLARKLISIERRITYEDMIFLKHDVFKVGKT